MRRSVLLSLGVVGALLVAGCVKPPPPPDPGPELCAPGTFSPTGEAPCTPAPVGTFVDTAGATEPIECDLGTYQDEEGQTECKPALPGTFVDVTGATAATLCPLGRFQPNAGAIECLLAPIGTYVDFVGAAAAINCPPGTTTEFAGATALSDCEEALLAVAYSNLDGTDGYDPTGTDVLIAKLVDTNVDGVVSVGDTIATGSYPLNFLASSFGSFQTTSHPVTSVVFAASTDIFVKNTCCENYIFTRGSTFESYSEYGGTGGGTAWLIDAYAAANAGDERIEVTSGSPSQPDTAVSSFRTNSTDQRFLEVDIFI